MRAMQFAKWVTCLVVLVLSGSTQAFADQAVWGPVTGRTNQVQVVHTFEGDVNVDVFLNVLVPDSHHVTGYSIDYIDSSHETTSLDVTNPTDPAIARMVDGTCLGSLEPNCTALASINSCNWNLLTVTARNALTYLLGSCSKTCLQATVSAGLGLGSETIYHWSCADQHAAECLRMAGTLRFGLQVEVLERGAGCQF